MKNLRQLIFCLAFICPQGILAQTVPDIPIRKLHPNSNIIVGEMVYGRHFRIQGSMKLPQGVIAHVVELEIYRKAMNVNGSTVPEKSIGLFTWWQMQDDIKDDFDLYINEMLEFDTDYRFVFRFFVNTTTDDQVGIDILNSAVDDLVEDKARNPDISFDLNDVETAVNNQVKAYSKRKKIGKLSMGSGDSKIVYDLAMDISIRNKDDNFSIEELSKHISDKVELRSANESLKAGMNSLKKMYDNETIANFKRALSDKLEGITKDEEFDSNLQVKPGDKMYVYAFTDKTSDKTTDVKVNGESLKTLVTIGRSQEVKLVDYKLMKAINYLLFKKILEIGNDDKANFERFYTLFTDILTYQTSVAESETKVNASRLIIDNLQGLIEEGLREEQTLVSNTSTTPSSKATVETIRLGTSYGGAVVGLNALSSEGEDGKTNFKNMEGDVFSYIALKYFIKPVDKRIANPYLSYGQWSHTSVFFGFAVGGKLNYKGDTLLDAIGLKPVLGVSHDLNRYMSIDVGFIIFKQQSLSTLTDYARLRMAPFIALSLDADAFNRFKTLFKPEGYKITP